MSGSVRAQANAFSKKRAVWTAAATCESPYRMLRTRIPCEKSARGVRDAPRRRRMTAVNDSRRPRVTWRPPAAMLSELEPLAGRARGAYGLQTKAGATRATLYSIARSMMNSMMVMQQRATNDGPIAIGDPIAAERRVAAEFMYTQSTENMPTAEDMTITASRGRMHTSRVARAPRAMASAGNRAGAPCPWRVLQHPRRRTRAANAAGLWAPSSSYRAASR